MKKKLFRRIATCLLSGIMCMGALQGVAANENETKDYAVIVFGEQWKTKNLSIVGPHALKSVTRDGRAAVSTDITQTTMNTYFNIDDKFMNGIPNHTPVDITVEYFDEGKGYFTLMYNSYEASVDLTRALNVTAPTALAPAEAVFMENTMTWKSHTFRIYDMRTSNLFNHGSDFSIHLWVPLSDSTSPENVIIGSVKVEYSDDPVHEKVSSEYEGNIFALDEDVVLNLNGFNIENAEVKADYVYKVKNSDGEIVREGAHSAKFAPYAEQTEKITIPNPGRYDLYTIDIDAKYEWKECEFSETIKNGFSVAMVYEDGDLNSELGQMQHIGNKHRGNPEKVAEIMKRAGMSSLRDDTPGTTLQDNEYVLDSNDLARWKRYKEAGGGEIIAQLGSGSQLARGLAWNDLPDEPEEYKAYAEFCTDVVTQLKGITNYFEIWNEPNITFGNINLAPPECYAEMCKAAIPAIRKANPDAVILIGCTAASGSNETWMDEDFHRRIFEAGALEGADAVSIHPYDWSGEFREQRFLKGARDLRAMMDEYGGQDKEIWITEFGFSTNTGGGGGHGYTRDQSARNFVMSYNIMKAYDVIDYCSYYALYDRVLPLDVENNWGWLSFGSDIKWRGEYDYSSAAKEAYLAMLAAGHFFGDDAEVKGHIYEQDGELNAYATHYYNKAYGKDVLVLQTNNKGSKQMNIKLGCDTVEIYDVYGNKLDTVASPSGVYTFIADNEPMYAMGSFGSIAEKSETEGAVMADVSAVDCALADSAIFNFKKNIDKELKIEVDGAEISENNGFIGDTARIKIKASADKKGIVDFYVRISDADGNVYYGRKHEMNIGDPVKVTLSTEQATEDNVDRWRIRAVVESMANDAKLSGIVRVKEPIDMAAENVMRGFQELEPHEKITFVFNIPKKISKNVLTTRLEVVLSDGYAAEYETESCFSTAVYAEMKPTIDGIIDVGEWQGSWIGADTDNDYVKLLEDRNGSSDLSFSSTMMWDEDYFYFVAITTDNVFFTGHEPSGIGNSWRGDGLQIGLDDRDEINSVTDGDFAELSIAYVPGIGDTVYKSKKLYECDNLKIPLEGAEIKIKRYDTYTAYECKVPWDEIFYEDYVLKPEAPFRYSVLVNDNDGAGRKGYLEYTSGIGGTKSASQFGDLKFKK